MRSQNLTPLLEKRRFWAKSAGGPATEVQQREVFNDLLRHLNTMGARQTEQDATTFATAHETYVGHSSTILISLIFWYFVQVLIGFQILFAKGVVQLWVRDASRTSSTASPDYSGFPWLSSYRSELGCKRRLKLMKSHRPRGAGRLEHERHQ